jgi:hypothetical protein
LEILALQKFQHVTSLLPAPPLPPAVDLPPFDAFEPSGYPAILFSQDSTATASMDLSGSAMKGPTKYKRVFADRS